MAQLTCKLDFVFLEWQFFSTMGYSSGIGVAVLAPGQTAIIRAPWLHWELIEVTIGPEFDSWAKDDCSLMLGFAEGERALEIREKCSVLRWEAGNRQIGPEGFTARVLGNESQLFRLLCTGRG